MNRVNRAKALLSRVHLDFFGCKKGYKPVKGAGCQPVRYVKEEGGKVYVKGKNLNHTLDLILKMEQRKKRRRQIGNVAKGIGLTGMLVGAGVANSHLQSKLEAMRPSKPS